MILNYGKNNEEITIENNINLYFGHIFSRKESVLFKTY